VEERTGEVVGQQMLSTQLPVIAGHLRDNGYASFGVSTNPHMTHATGFDRGFDRFASLGFVQAPSANVTARKFLGEMRAAPKYFLWVHYFDPHDPYLARMPWIEEYSPDKSSYAKWANVTMKGLRARMDEIASDPTAVQALKDLYDSEIQYTDSSVRELVESLPSPERTMIIITSDHGEGFLDHGNLGHGNSLFEELVRVPLIIAPPDGKPRAGIVGQPVSIVDIFPTICAAAGIRTPEAVQGKSLLPLMNGGRQDNSREIVSELNRLKAAPQQVALRRGKWKFVKEHGRAETRALYELESDPGEERNLVRAEPVQAARMEAALSGWLDARPEFHAPESDKPLSDKQRQELRALGYLD
jgi:arylsulfatase A-like enzyme